MNKKVLITGASGFVGYHLIAKAIKAGYDVYGAVRASSDLTHLSEFDIRFTHLNYNSVEDLNTNILENQYDYIIHASGTTKAKSKAEYNLINADYSKNLALASLGTSVKKFVFVSSLAAIGPLDEITAEIEPGTIPNPVTSYGSSKLYAEELLNSIPGLPLIVIRPTAVYGPREKDLFIIFKSINMGLEPYIGKFKQQFSFIYVKDLAAILVSCLESEIISGSYNVSDGNKYDRYALADYSKKLLKKNTFKFHLPVSCVGFLASVLDKVYANSTKTTALNKEKMHELTAINWACNISPIQQDLGFIPRYNLETGVAETIEWYKKNKWLS